MNVIFCPNLHGLDDVEGQFKKLFQYLRKKHPDLFALVRTTIEEVEKKSNIDMLIRQEKVALLNYAKVPLYEFRIPPQRRGGVVRLYFGYKKNDKNTIVILAGELKHKKESDSVKIKLAEKYYKEVCL
jgi:hypothetical protein